MSERQIINALQKLLMEYKMAERFLLEEQKAAAAKARMKRIDKVYIQICDECSLYSRVGLPYHIEDVLPHVLLVDEILNGTLFCI